MSACYGCCFLLGKNHFDELIICTEESYGYLSIVTVVFYHVEVCETGCSLVQRSPIDVFLFWVLCVCQVEVCVMSWSFVQRSRMDVCLLWLFCVVIYRTGRRPDHLYRGVVWMYVFCVCCVLSVRGLYVGLVTFTEESYWCRYVVNVVCCQLESCASSWLLEQRSPMDVCLLWV